MKSRATLGGSPIHPMLVSFPIAFYTAATLCYIAYAFGVAPFWFYVGYTANIAGLVCAVLAAIPGLMDLRNSVPSRTAAKATGTNHMLLHLAALFFFGVNAWLQTDDWNMLQPTGEGSVFLSIIGLGCTLAGAYLGSKMVRLYHVGVDETPGIATTPIDVMDARTDVRGVRPSDRDRDRTKTVGDRARSA